MTNPQPPQTSLQRSQAKLLSFLASANLSKLGVASLVVVSLSFVTFVALQIADRTKVHRLKLAAGAIQGESYVISKSIEQVVEKYHPNIQIEVIKTGGTAENIQRLEENQVQLATAQADVPVGASARLISILYPDRFQLIVPNNSPINQFSDLKGKRISLPKTGGQFQSFVNVAAHFGLAESDFTFVGETELAANEAFLRNQADAAFRVRALVNPSILQLVQNGSARLVPIPQAAAMKIKYPAFEVGIIPQGAYRGNPPIPAIDLATVQVQRTLLAHEKVDPEVIRNITMVIMERRQELANAIAQDDIKPLVANINPPSRDSGIGAPIHPGSQAYYERDKPSFVQENADFLALILTIFLLLWSWGLELKRLLVRVQKNAADEYSKKVIHLLNEVPKSNDLRQLEVKREELLKLLTSAVNDLDKDVISEESFQSFRVIWQIALDTVRERRITLYQQQSPSVPPPQVSRTP
ncbi:TAXI family TRAP transporter solute-binding subunit [Microseira wollei]|uniref:TRAP transporter solute receptor, TAXI family protein n=1 Tax=Microseira wollei NIES-4236 TaxID=2530354 RepID=A0AAV3XPS0_9CYAN|nr:TAXI family TRAP transporter solute-binding subunit [Microseira wollei]GET43648.1 TRAP transporter solute receptor, TAXI family protein [Microseira wollei NIES-4236]